MIKPQKFARRDANVLTEVADHLFCKSAMCLGYCQESHDWAAQKRVREIALRLVSRGYGPTPRQRGRAPAP